MAGDDRHHAAQHGVEREVHDGVRLDQRRRRLAHRGERSIDDLSLVHVGREQAKRQAGGAGPGSCAGWEARRIRHQQAQILLVQRAAGQGSRLLLINIRDADVELEIDQLDPQLVEPEKAYVYLHAGVPFQKTSVNSRQYRRACRHCSQSNSSRQRVFEDRELLQHGVSVRQNPFGPLDDPTSFSSEALKPLVPQNDRSSELRFQLLDGV